MEEDEEEKRGEGERRKRENRRRRKKKKKREVSIWRGKRRTRWRREALSHSWPDAKVKLPEGRGTIRRGDMAKGKEEDEEEDEEGREGRMGEVELVKGGKERWLRNDCVCACL